MPATRPDHFTVLTADLEETRVFYEKLLGLKDGYRPPFAFPGLWLYAGDKPILHVIGPQTLPEQRHGVIDHMAFAATGLVETVGKLKDMSLEYALRRQAESRIWQLFFTDPNGAMVELDFAPEEKAPADAG